MSEQASVPPHWLRHNLRSWSPARVAVVDVEATVRGDLYGESHQWRLGAAAWVRRRGGPGPTREAPEAAWFRTPEELWAWVDARTDRNETLWVYCHHLDYDAVVSRVFQVLPALGWQMTAIACQPRLLYVRWRRGRRRLVLADSVSLLGTSVEQLGRDLGCERPWRAYNRAEAIRATEEAADWSKLPMPDDGDPELAWAEYCQRDVAITLESVLLVMDWWDASDLGTWRPTGAGCGWAALRHRWLSHKVLVHRDQEVLALERAALYGGRRECYRLGRLEDGPYVQLDSRQAYARIAHEELLPRRLMGRFESLDVDRYRARGPTVGVIAEVEVDTPVPVVPVRTPTGIVYPVGRFRTVLCSPEIDLALEVGAQVRIGRGAWYALAPVLREWADWILGLLDAPDDRVHPIIRRVVKGWSRSVIGKFAQLGRVEHVLGPAPPGLALVERVIDGVTREHTTILTLGGTTRELRQSIEPDNSVPAIAAWVASVGRVRLWRLMEAVGPDRVVHVDTDAVVASFPDAPHPRDCPPGPDENGKAAFLDPDWWLPASAADTWRDRLTVKGVWRTVELLGPACWRAADRWVVKGLPAGARSTDHLVWEVCLWPGLLWQVERGRHSDYTVVHGRWQYVTPWRGRHTDDDGHTRPWVLPDEWSQLAGHLRPRGPGPPRGP